MRVSGLRGGSRASDGTGGSLRQISLIPPVTTGHRSAMTPMWCRHGGWAAVGPAVGSAMPFVA
ncbi:hypothetical protein DPEC_G00333430 [Dallia pectoralis]|uniref:Uncharacterized protein n=1 Tax=Dallia pectoralis TaxID=75939 RepID=A0ACC2F6G1_DALPE|nr:hypothetical protein DPEC_G00333430 [Dallia pectoralis]